jgi:hypothetical protein
MLKKPVMDKQSSLLGAFVSYEKKGFLAFSPGDDHGPRADIHKLSSNTLMIILKVECLTTKI